MLLAAVLAGCGGGGGGGGEPFKYTFAPNSAATFAQESVAQYVVSGDCKGGRVRLRGVLTPATFNGQAVSAVTSTVDQVLANCAAAGSGSSSQTAYYDGRFAVVGNDNSSGSVAVADTPILPPSTMKIGDSGTFGAETLYSDSTRTTVVSHGLYTYSVEFDTYSSALAVLTNTVTDASGKVMLTETTRYVLHDDGTRSLLSIDDQFTTPSPLHIVYTPGTVATTLAAGQTVTLAAGQMLLVPAGTTVTSASNTSSLRGQLDTVSAAAGAVVSVPANATGPADNVVTAH
jgi:hypothetical protein